MLFGRAKMNIQDWLVAILLLLATMLNYMDRQTLSTLSKRVVDQFQLSNEQYGYIEGVFGYSFAVGSLFFGFVADRCSVRWLYPAVLILWSIVGLLTGFVESYMQLLMCRMALGFFEAGHWPCALVTTHRLISSDGRTFANSLLQSGASLGAILTPLVISAMVGVSTQKDVWRMPFLVIGALGIFWVVAWLMLLPKHIFKTATEAIENTSGTQPKKFSFSLFFDRRFWAVAIMIVSINVPWQLIRAWFPKFLQEGRNYTELFTNGFNSAYFFATDIGCVLSGAAVSWLIATRWKPHHARLLVFAVCACLTALTGLAAITPAGPALLAILLIIGAASLALFPCYYSFAQSLSDRHVGTASGLLAAIGWLAIGPVQPIYGRLIDQTHSYDLGLGLVGFFPLIGAAAMLLLWPNHDANDADKTTA